MCELCPQYNVYLRHYLQDINIIIYRVKVHVLHESGFITIGENTPLRPLVAALSIPVSNFHQNFKNHTLRCVFLYIHDEQVYKS